MCEMVLQRLPRLQTLKANGIWISDSACDAIAASELVVLEMDDTCGYTDNGIISLMNGCSSLRKLHINQELVNSLVRKLWIEGTPQLQIVFC